MLTIVFLIGLLSGVLTGLLSVGGGIILIFLFIILPPLMMNTHLTMQTIAGFSLIQAVFSTLSGSISYIRSQLIDRHLVVCLGLPSFFGGIIGSLTASYVSEVTIKIVFCLLSMIAAIVMQWPQKRDHENKIFHFTPFSIVLIGLSGILVGLLGGLVGLAGGFIFLPVMIYIFRLPIKKAIGTSLITSFLLSAGALMVKIGVNSPPLDLGIAMVIGGIVGSQIGSWIGKRAPSLVLRKIAAFSILFISIKLIYDLF